MSNGIADDLQILHNWQQCDVTLSVAGRVKLAYVFPRSSQCTGRKQDASRAISANTC